MNTDTNHPFRSARAREKYFAHNDRLAAKYWPIESDEKMVATSYGQTFIRAGGKDGNPALVLLPGGNNTSLMWWQNISDLSQHFKTYAVDNIVDIGKSIPKKDIKRPEEFVVWLNELFDGLGLNTGINIVGLSYGGWIACNYALQSQGRLNKLALLAPAATVLPLCKEFWVRVMASALIPHPYFTKSLLTWLCEDMSKKDNSSRAILKDAIDDFYTSIRAFKPRKLPVPTVLQDDELKKITVPTLYLVGENEKIYSAQQAVQRLNAIVPAITTEIIPGAGHDLSFVKPKAINRKIIEFLE